MKAVLYSLHGQGDTQYVLLTPEDNEALEEYRQERADETGRCDWNDLALTLQTKEEVEEYGDEYDLPVYALLVGYGWSVTDLTAYMRDNDIEIVDEYEGYIY